MAALASVAAVGGTGTCGGVGGTGAGGGGVGGVGGGRACGTGTGGGGSGGADVMAATAALPSYGLPACRRVERAVGVGLGARRGVASGARRAASGGCWACGRGRLGCAKGVAQVARTASRRTHCIISRVAAITKLTTPQQAMCSCRQLMRASRCEISVGITIAPRVALDATFQLH